MGMSLSPDPPFTATASEDGGPAPPDLRQLIGRSFSVSPLVRNLVALGSSRPRGGGPGNDDFVSLVRAPRTEPAGALQKSGLR